MDFVKGDLVIHPNRPEWGNGSVQQFDKNKNLLVINFENEGKKELYLSRVNFELIKLERNAENAEHYHKDFIKTLGKPYVGIRPRNQNKPPRVTHCYSCKKMLDSKVDYECNACDWILCACGACGCGFIKNQP